MDTIRDPGNLGTILRIADWFGLDAVFAAKDTEDVFNPKVVQATMGAVFRVKMHYVDLPSLAKIVLASGGKLYGTFLDGEDMYGKDLQNNGIIVMGNEGNGIGAGCAAHVTERIFIPNYPAERATSESLNVSMATAIICSEFRRRARR